jgi:excisionase family DNA binding protein
MKIDLTNIVYTVSEVAFIFRVSKRKLTQLIEEGQIKAISFGKRHKVIPRSEVERFLGCDLRFVDLAGLGSTPKPAKTPHAIMRLLKK